MSEALNHAAEAAGRIRAPSRRTLKWSRELSLLTVIILVVIAVGAYDGSFVAEQNLRFMILNSVVLSLVALGQTLVIATRGIDLSVAPILGLGAVVPGLLAPQSGLPLWGAVLIVLSMGAVLGTLNGVLVANLGIPPIIVTLGTYSIYGGFMFIYSDGVQVYAVPKAYEVFGNGLILGVIPIPVAALAVVAAVIWFMVNHMTFGRALLAVGNNEAAAYNAGISCASVVVGTYVLAGVLACFAGLVFVSSTGSATVTTGTGDPMELQSVAVALIGGRPQSAAGPTSLARSWAVCF